MSNSPFWGYVGMKKWFPFFYSGACDWTFEACKIIWPFQIFLCSEVNRKWLRWVKVTPPWQPSVWNSARHWLAFNFSLKIGFSYSFSLDARDKGVDLNIASKTRKWKSPSILRRNARRKEDFLKKKQNPASVTPEPGVEPDVGLPRGEGSFKCDICGNFFKSDNGLMG